MLRTLPLLALLVMVTGCSQQPEGDPQATTVPNPAQTYAPDALDGKSEAPTGTKITPPADETGTAAPTTTG